MKILPDGTIEIRNKNTGETKIVQPADLPSYGIPYSSYASELEAAKKIGVETTAAITPTPTAAELKNKDAFRSTENFIKELENSYTSGGGGTKGIGPGARIKGAIATLAGNVGLNADVKTYNDAKAGFAATLKTLTGDTGMLTDQDYIRLAGLLPDFGSTKQEAENKFNQIRSQIAAKFGGEKTETGFKPQFENERGAIASLTDILFPQLTSFAENPLEAGRKASPFTYVGKSPGEAASGFWENVIKPASGMGSEVATGITALGGLKNIGVGGLKNILNPKPALSEARQQAAGAISKKISTDSIIEAGEKYVIRDPTAARLWNDVLKPVLVKTKELSVSELLEQTKVWNDAYTTAGRVGKTALAGLTDTLARSAKELIKSEAPEVAKYTSKLASRYGLEKVLGRFGPAAVGAAGAITGATILGKILGRRQQGY